MMKKILAVSISLLIILSLVGCNRKEETKEVSDVKTKELVGICLPAADHGWVAAVAYFAEQQAKALDLNYKLVTSSTPNEQANQVDQLIDMNCHTIVIFPHNNELDVAAQKILDAGINLVNFDRKVAVDSTSYLAGDNPGIGVNGAKYIGEKIEGKGKVVILHVPAYGSIDVERVDGFKNTIASEYPDIEIIGDYGSPSSSKEDGLKIMSDVLTANPQIDAVYSMDDELSIGILQAIKDSGRTDVKAITGGGGAQEYFNHMGENEDIWVSSALYSPAMIKDCVEIAADLVAGKTVDKEIVIDAKIVDRENVSEYLDSNSPY
jgi:ribose transport system substrate-binding protein